MVQAQGIEGGKLVCGVKLNFFYMALMGCSLFVGFTADPKEKAQNFKPFSVDSW
jgi:hypothetical protein